MGRSINKEMLSDIHILVAEDEMVIRALLVDVLRQTGFTVTETTCVAEALKAVQEIERLDLLFTDVRMPGAMNGLDLARQLRRERPSLKIIVTSAHLDPLSVEGLGVFLPKPYLMHHAEDLVFEQLGIE